MRDLAAERGGLGHEKEGHNRQQQHDGHVPTRQMRDATPLPQREPGEEARDLHEGERQQRGVFVRPDGHLRHVGPPFDDRFGAVARDIRRDGDSGHDEEDGKTGPLEAVVLSGQGHQEQREPQSESDGRNMIEQHVQM